jgi:hypothetical protein
LSSSHSYCMSIFQSHFMNSAHFSSRRLPTHNKHATRVIDTSSTRCRHFAEISTHQGHVIGTSSTHGRHVADTWPTNTSVNHQSYIIFVIIIANTSVAYH